MVNQSGGSYGYVLHGEPIAGNVGLTDFFGDQTQEAPQLGANRRLAATASPNFGL
jgi:hypothetical protein